MCSAPAPSGAAIRKTRSAGPSGAPKSTAGARRAKASDAVETAADRQWGIAMPPGRPVADCDSLAEAASATAAASVARSAAASRPASAVITALLSAPRSASSAIKVGVMIESAIVVSFRSGGGAGWAVFMAWSVRRR